MLLDTIKTEVKSYFNLTSFLENQDESRQSILDGISFRGPNIIILILAMFIACLGLNTNSTAVIIGAMLISPLMGPIIGLGLGVGTYNYPIVKRSLRNLAAAAAFSVLASTLYFLISPVGEGHSELLARTSPTIYDVFVGFFGGAAGFVAIVCKQKGNVIPGVAIATSLMPPLCTVGYGIATWQLQYAVGAFYLFLINSIFIAVATLIGVKLFKFQEYNFINEERKKKVKTWIYIIVGATLLPSIYLTIQMLQVNFFINDANRFITEEFQFPNTQVFSKNVYVKHWKKYMDINLIGQQVNIDSLQMAMTAKMSDQRMLRGTHLTITQGFSTGATPQGLGTSDINKVFTTALSEMSNQQNRIDSLRNVILAKENFDSISYTIAPEIQVLYPEITYIAINRSFVCNTETRHIDTLNIALIENNAPLVDEGIIKRYIETRTGLPDIHIIQTRIPLSPE